MNNKELARVIALTERMVVLLKEYKEAKIYENCIYHVVIDQSRPNTYFLIEISSGQIVRHNTANNFLKFLYTRKVDHTQVYNVEILSKNQPQIASYRKG